MYGRSRRIVREQHFDLGKGGYSGTISEATNAKACSSLCEVGTGYRITALQISPEERAVKDVARAAGIDRIGGRYGRQSLYRRSRFGTYADDRAIFAQGHTRYGGTKTQELLHQ
jgi:hypothetical protein